MRVLLRGRLDEAETELRESVGTLDKVGDWFGLFSHHILRHVYAVRGDIPRELAEAEAEIAIGTAARRRGERGLGAIWQGRRPGPGRPDRRGPDLVPPARSSRSPHAIRRPSARLPVLGFVRLQASDYSGARAALEQSRSSVKRTFFFIEFVADLYPMLVESLLGPHWADAEGGPSRAVARKASRESRFARFIGWRYPNYPPARPARQRPCRLCPRQAEESGAQYLERSIAAAEKLGARYDLARALLDASRVIPERADDYRRRGQQLLDELGAVVPEAERFSP